MKPFVFILALGLLTAGAKAQEQRPEPIVQTAHSLPVNCVAYSSDGRLIASGGNDGIVKLWDTSTGTELRTFYGHPAGLEAIAFSPDGSRLATASDKTFAPLIIVWDIQTGAELLREDEIFGDVTAMSYRSDGVLLSLDVLDEEMIVWDVAAKKEIIKIAGNNTEKLINLAAFSPDGALLAVVENKKVVSVREVATGKELRRFDKHRDEIGSVIFSHDGRLLVTTSYDKTVKVWEGRSGKEVSTFSVPANVAGVKESFTFASFNRDDSKVVAGGFQTLMIWELKTGRHLQSIPLTDDIYVRSVVFSPDDKQVAGGVSSSRLKVWDVDSGATLLALPRDLRFSSGRDVEFSPDGKTLFTHVVGSKMNLWDVKNGLPARSFKARSDSRLVFSADGRMTAYSDFTDAPVIKLRETESGTVIREIKTKMSEFLSFNPDGWLVGGVGFLNDTPTSLRKSLVLYDVQTGEERFNVPDVFRRFAFSPNGEFIAAPLGFSSKAVRVWEVKTGREVKTIPAGRFTTYAVAYSPDGKTLAAVGYDKDVKLWDTTTWAQKPPLTTTHGHFDTLTFSPDGSLLVLSGSDNDGKIDVWDVAAQKEIYVAQGHAGGTDKIAFHPSGKFFVSVGKDTLIRFWGAKDGGLLATLIEFDNDGWVVTDPNGLFDGSSRELRQLLWRLSPNLTDVVPLEAFFKEFYYPSLLQEILAGKTPAPPGRDFARVDIRQPDVKISVLDAMPLEAKAGMSVDKSTVKIRIEVADNVGRPRKSDFPSSGGARDLRLFRNGSLVRAWRGDVFGGESGCEPAQADPGGRRRTICQAEIPVVAGENTLTAYAFNSSNVKSADATASVKGADSLKRAAVLHILAIGIKDYSNPAFNLRYAVADAESLAAEIQNQQKELKNFADVKVTSLFDAQATKQNILNALDDLRRQVRPTDTVLVFFSGHGLANEPRFYLIPYDLGYSGTRTKEELTPKLGQIYAHGISDEELSHVFEGIDAGQMFLIIDACNSGQALESEEKRRGPMNSRGLAQLAYEKGMYILTAAQSYQAAREASRLGHGYLTYALVKEGLALGKADEEPRDGQILAREWFDYATERVPQMQHERMSGAKSIEEEGGSTVVFVEGDENVADVSQRRAQTPRVFYRRESDVTPFVVARTSNSVKTQ